MQYIIHTKNKSATKQFGATERATFELVFATDWFGSIIKYTPHETNSLTHYKCLSRNDKRHFVKQQLF